jgi:hypothetical protein
VTRPSGCAIPATNGSATQAHPGGGYVAIVFRAATIANPTADGEVRFSPTWPRSGHTPVLRAKRPWTCHDIPAHSALWRSALTNSPSPASASESAIRVRIVPDVTYPTSIPFSYKIRDYSNF